jgi:uncharacterized membrane protein
MNKLFGGSNNEEDSMIPLAFGFLVPLVLAIVCFVYAAKSSQNDSKNNENIKKLQTILYVQGSIYILIFGLYSISIFLSLESPYLILFQKLVILSLIAMSGYGLSVYDQTDPAVKEIRNVVFGISIVGLLTGLPLIKAIPKCILNNIKTELI